VALLAALGIALVTGVFTFLLAMSQGFASALRSTGRPDNAMIVQRGSMSELTSMIWIPERQRILDDPRLARGSNGEVLASWEWIQILSLARKRDGQRTNVTLRAVTPRTFDVRGGIRVTAGRRFTPGLDEIIVGRRIMGRIRGLELGDVLRYARKEHRVVGVFESDGAAFESEVWGDFDTLGSLFRRGGGSSCLVVRMKDAAEIPALDQWIRSQPGMLLRAVSERQYYEEMSGAVTVALKAIATLVSVIMGVGAVFATMNTMYAIVAARTREIGTLRALGFSRRAILFSLVAESAFLALAGGLAGCLLALPIDGLTTSLSNVQSFSEVAFDFRVTPAIVGSSLLSAVVMGLIGGLLPSLRAARLPIAQAMREV
jgi:putative ABC transport system permease protein